jgi:probable F420-dependent oxidoreductase
MDIGFDIRTPAAAESPSALTDLVVAGESMGFDYTTISDHLVAVSSVQPKYGEGRSAGAGVGRSHEQLTTIAFLAAKTTRLRFVSAVLVAPYRPAVLAAKMLSTIDHLSGGRLTIGVGTGWVKDEFAALGASFGDRGRTTNEHLTTMKRLWAGESAGEAPSEVRDGEGEGADPSKVFIYPPSLQRPHPPIWIGGMSAPAMRRAAQFADSWYPMMNDAAKPLDTLGLLRQGIAEIRQKADEAGRNPDDVTVALRIAAYGEEVDPTGPLADHCTDLRAIEDLGVASVDFRFADASPEKVVEKMEAFAFNTFNAFP